MWWLRRSIRMTSTSARRSARAAAIPAKPAPTMTTRFRSRWEASTPGGALSGPVSANIALIGSPRWCSLSLTASASFCRERCSQRSRYSDSLQHTGSREIASLQRAGLPGEGTALSGSGFTVIMNIAKHRAPTTNVTTVNVCFTILRISCFAGPISALQPLGFARAARHKHRPEEVGSPRQNSLVGHPLIRSQRRLRGEQIRSNVRVLVGRSGRRLGILLVEDAERQQPQHGPGQRNSDPITAAFDRSPAERCENADSAEPAHDIVDNGNDGRRFGMCERAFCGEHPGYGCTDFIESGTIFPGTLVAVKQDLSMNQARLLRGERFGIQAVALQITRALVGKEDVGIFQQLVEFRAILFRAIEERGTHPDLRVPSESIDLGVVGPPDIEDIRAVTGEVSTDDGSGNHMPHSKGANTIQRALTILLERDRLALADLLHRNQRHLGKDFSVLSLLPEFLEGAYLRKDEPRF